MENRAISFVAGNWAHWPEIGPTKEPSFSAWDKAWTGLLDSWTIRLLDYFLDYFLDDFWDDFFHSRE